MPHQLRWLMRKSCCFQNAATLRDGSSEMQSKIKLYYDWIINCSEELSESFHRTESEVKIKPHQVGINQ
jgi:hypothetical protein